MTNEEKARYEELDAKDCLVDEEDVIDYYSLHCEILEERIKALEQENQELKEQLECKSKGNEIIIKQMDLFMKQRDKCMEENEKLTKAIEWLKENLNFKIEKHKSSPNCMFVSYKDLQEWLEPSNEIVDLLEEVLE